MAFYMASRQPNPMAVLAAARAGDREALGNLTELYRNYLYLIAQVQVGRHMRRRLSPSDLVQETMVKALKNLHQFRGSTERELLGWLRSILVHALKSAVEHEIKAGKRNLHREVSLHDRFADMDSSIEQFDAALISQFSSPSQQAHRRELAAVVADQLARLPKQYREIIVQRNLEGLTFDEIAERTARSPGAARILWVRALRRLQQLAEEPG
jgi:RNA polymerase sigma-70 factor (ECF subfamily)